MKTVFYGVDKTAAIHLYERCDGNGRLVPVLSGDLPLPSKFFTPDDLAFIEYDESVAGYLVANVGYCIKQARDWEDCVGDFCDDAAQHKFKRRAYIEVIDE